MRVLTADVFAAAWLVSQGASVVELLVDRSPFRASGTFVLEGTNGTDVLALHEAYCRGQATAPVKAIRDAVSDLRTRLAKALREPTSRRGSPARLTAS